MTNKLHFLTKTAMLVVVALMLMPQTMQAYSFSWEDYETSYPFWASLHYEANDGNPYIEWETVLWDDCGDDEGFFKDDDHKKGLKLEMQVGSGSKVFCGYLACDENGWSRGLYKDGNAVGNSSVSWGYGGRWEFDYRETSYDARKEDHGIHTIKPRWYIPFEYRNANITIYLTGSWMKWNHKKGEQGVNESARVGCPYQYTVRQVYWNGDISVTPDGTVTIPYRFGGACNTDKNTHLCTSINGSYNGTIGYKTPATNYANGSYTFKLSDIGKNLLSNNFTIEPYHEYTHYNDKDNSDGTKYYATFAGPKTFYTLPKATLKSVEFNQVNKKVVLTWTPSNYNYGNGRWVIYRDGSQIGVVGQGTTTFTDTGFPTETEVAYTIYYVMNNWKDTDKVDQLKSNEKKVNTTRKVPIRHFNAGSQADRIALTWQSDSLPKGWGHQFKIYVDKESEPVYTITPTDGQTEYRWEHRTTNQHEDRVNKTEGTTYYTEEPLNATNPHSYRVESVIGTLIRDTASAQNLSIGTGTTFYSLEASKNTYAGQVKLSWHVNRQGSTVAQTYIIERRRAEKKTDVWAKLERTSSTDDYLIYTDNTPLPGVHYEYRVSIEEKRPDGTLFTNEATDIGFAQASGTISGRISFGSSGMAVQGVEVKVKKIGEDDVEEQYHSVHLTSTKGKLTWDYPSATYAQETFADSTATWTIQMWINPDTIKEQRILTLGKNLAFGMRPSGQPYLLTSKFVWFNNFEFKAHEYYHFTIIKKEKYLYFRIITPQGKLISQRFDFSPEFKITNSGCLTIGGFEGYVDEFRLWTRVLTDKELNENFDHLLVGSEKNLEIYWPFDEGLSTQFFDYSRDGTDYHSHHGKMGVNTQPSSYTPDTLALRARTDSVGNYIIRGVPFSGEGTTYAVIPMLGVHSFNPSQQLRYVSANSLVHNGTDFDDVSSFPVSGTVYYAGTNYPVEGCNFYVDGQACSKDGEMITTNAYGQYTISVPIGEHFIQVKKQGHEFVNNGRYPKETDRYWNFDREMKNMTFYDSTLVNFTGRVVGGDIEGDKPIGFGQSTNNIGIATLTLIPRNIENTNYYINAFLPTDGTVIEYEPNANKVTVVSASPDTIHSVAWRGFGSKDECQKFYIRTDSLTGEFSAMLPPLDYLVSRISIPKAELELIKNPVALDMTNPQISYTDSAQRADGQMQYYSYHTLLRQTYHSQPIFTVQQTNHPDGSFGIDEHEIEDGFGTLKLTDIHHINPITKEVEYTYGYPLFKMGDYYTFKMKGYEEYVNRDNKSNVVTSTVPLANTVVTIENALSADQIVCGEDNTIGATPGSVYELKSNQLLLDSIGAASYKWMAGLPNITPPFTRTLNIYYTVDNIDNNWTGNGMEAVILGELSTGNNFVTDAPDKLDMVLRDPPGSQSFATWEQGTVMEYDTVKGSTWNQEAEVKSVFHIGNGLTAAVGWVGLYTIVSTKAKDDLTVGVKEQCEGESSNTLVRKLTATRTISTSDSPEYVGADGDLYIGSATNIIFGKTRSVDLYRNTADTSKAFLDLQDALSADLSFGTKFAYSQLYIENTLIPNFYGLRNSLLQPVDAATYNNKESASGNEVEYITTLSRDDPFFGAKGTYKALKPSSMTMAQDMVDHYTRQIEAWEGFLRDNEEAKVRVFEQRAELEKTNSVTNYSFDAGSRQTISRTSEVSHTHAYRRNTLGAAIIGNATGWEFNGLGLELDIMTSTGGGTHMEHNRTADTTATFSYTFRDDDITDALSVDVFEEQQQKITYKQWKKDHPGDSIPGMKDKNGKDIDTAMVLVNVEPAYHAPIFRTRGGQTSNPYEGTVYARYFEPAKKHIIMEGTMQVEKPEIEVVNPLMANIPSGSTVDYVLKLRNASDVNADCNFRLLIADETNPDGAILTIDGKPVTNDRIIKVPFGQEVTKTMQLKQGNPGILTYDSIAVILASVEQSDPTRNMAVIADTAYIYAHFSPSSSPVTLEVNTNIINTHTDTVLVLTMKDFDRNFYNLKAFRMQYKQQGGKWTDLHEYVLDGSHLSSNQHLLPDSMNVVYRLSMKNAMSWSDATYTFRIVSVSTFGTDEVYVYSNEETVIKDTAYPRPLGQAQPADGVLEIGDELSITYNIPFISGALSPENFLVTGVLNGAPVEHFTALHTYADDTQATAHTEANINLSGKDFSVDAWLNIQSDGVLLSHGVDKQKMTIATNEKEQLVISFGDSVYTSQAAVPRNKWVFFTMSRKVATGNGKMNVAIAYDKDNISLFTNVTVPLYYGNGPIAVGGGAIAAVHELLLWDEARGVATAWQESSVTKSPSTRHLIGYWKMNEGEGTFIRDYARNRNMVMPAESWYLNNINKAVTLNGKQHFAACTANVPPLPQDDYAMEMWLQGGAQNDTAQLMQLGEISIWLDKNGQLHLQSGEMDQIINHNLEILNNTWHHILLNVRRYGTAAVYIDGERALTVSADKIGSFASDSLIIGAKRTYVPETDTTVAHYHYDRHFKGAIDEVRIWKTTISSDMLASKRKLRLNGDEPGLSLYYPFEKKRLNENTQIVTEGSLEELSINEKGNHNGTEAAISGQSSAGSQPFTDDAPALKEKPTQTNVAFSFTASERKIVIDLDEAPATIDGCTLNFTVKDVRSVNGNPSLPATWSAFIHRNELAWQDDDLSIVKKVDTTFSITTAIINRSGTPQRWSLSDLPASLSASSTSGMLDPLEKATITFVCHETAPLGKHERTIYAMGNNGVLTPLTLHLKVIGEVPDWHITPAEYESSMNVISQLDFFGHISDDDDDIVAAFIGDECRGVTQSEYKERYDGYYQTLTIYGKPEDQGKQVTFQAYRASTGVYYTLVTPSKKIYYNPLSIVGRYDEPVLLSVNDQIVQRTPLKKGWNWISLFTEASDMRPKTVFADIANDVEVIKGRTNSIGCLVRVDSVWDGEMAPLLTRRSYMVKMKNANELLLIGKGINPATHTVRIHKGWGWPGYYGLHHITLANALAGADPQNGDVVRTQSAAAYFDDYEWVGSLQTLEPGQGYAYYSVSDDEKWFAYPSSSVSAAPRRSPLADSDEDPVYTGRFAPDDEYAYPYNMILIGLVLYDNEPAPNAEIAFFDGDECRSVGYTDEDGRIMLMIAGEEEATLSCKLVLNDKVHETVETLPYVTDAVLGTPAVPHIIRFGEGQGIESVQQSELGTQKVFRDGILYIIRNGEIYNAQGARVE